MLIRAIVPLSYANAIVCLSAALAVIACSESDRSDSAHSSTPAAERGSEVPRGTFALAEVDGDSIPWRYDGFIGCTVTVVAGRLVLGDSTWSDSDSSVVRCASADRQRQFRPAVETHGVLRFRGDTIVFETGRDSTGRFFAVNRGLVIGDTLRTGAPLSDSPPRTYLRSPVRKP